MCTWFREAETRSGFIRRERSNYEVIWQAKSRVSPLSSAHMEQATWQRPKIGVSALVACAAAIGAGLAQAQAPIAAAPVPTAAQSREASLAEYRDHLQSLMALVKACARERNAKACDPAQVGPDDRIPVAQAGKTGRRLVGYGWLRSLLSKAQDQDAAEPVSRVAGKFAKKDAGAQESVLPPPPTTTEMLGAAEARLTHDMKQAGAPPQAQPAYGPERKTMEQVLAGREFRNLNQPSAREAVLEQINDWLNQIFASAARFAPRVAWLGRVIVWGFLLLVGAGLVWGLMQFERRRRTLLKSASEASAAGAVPARDWQLWLEDARRDAAACAWRQAIHSVYWAVIARLEVRRLWPADRARTPREYLALVADDDPRKTGLSALTRSFERVWYGGRDAAEPDYRSAEQLAEELIAGGISSTRGDAAQ